MTRTFEARPATREQVPLLLGVIGPSSTGKTFSALRLATGIQRVTGGDIYGIDTESRRMLHYADKFKFQHVPFGAPFSSTDYLQAIEYCVKQGAKTVIIDSMSHEHESIGGMLEQHAAETKRLAALWKVKESAAQMAAWGPPKQKRRQMINTILQMPVNIIMCFRAKEKMKIKKGEDPENRGWMPIAGEELVYEMVLKCLLLPGANGHPTWQSDFEGERLMIKLPEQFKGMFSKDVQLSEDIGERLARWAAGDESASKPPATVDEMLARYEACSDVATARVLQQELGKMWDGIHSADKKRLKEASAACAKRLKEAESAPTPEHANGADPDPGPPPDDMGSGSGDRADIE